MRDLNKWDGFILRVLKVAAEADMVCDHSVGLCCGYHYEKHWDDKPTTKSHVLREIADLKKAMRDSDRANKDLQYVDAFDPKLYAALNKLRQTAASMEA